MASLSENSAATPVGAAAGVDDIPGHRAPPWRHHRGASYLLPWRSRAVRVKTQVPALARASDGDGLVASLLGGVVLESMTLLGNVGLFAIQCCRASGDGGCQGDGPGRQQLYSDAIIRILVIQL